MKVAGDTMKKGLCLLLTVLMMLALTACGTSGTDPGGSGSMRDPWEAYGMERGKPHPKWSSLEHALSQNPPAAILLRLAGYERMYYKEIPLSGDFLLERGKSVSVSLDLALVPLPQFGGESHSIKSNITVKYDGKRGEDLFHVDTNTYGNPTLYVDGKYVTKFGNHDVKNKAARMALIKVDDGRNQLMGFTVPEEVLYTVLHVDRGRATRADGNIGTVYFRIVGVRR